MDKLLLLLGASVLWFLSACQEHEDLRDSSNSIVATEVVHESSPRSLAQTEVKTSEEEKLSYEFAKLLQRLISQDAKVWELLQRETLKKFDGDHDFLVASLATEKQSSVRRSEDGGYHHLLNSLIDGVNRLTSSSYDEHSWAELLDSIAKQEPLLNIYMPDWGDLSQYDDFLVVVSPRQVNEREGYVLKAYNKKGEVVLLNSKEEPKLPYLVVGYNERVEAEPNTGGRSASFLRTKYYSYTLNEGYIPLHSEEADEIDDSVRAKPKVRKRSIVDRKSYEVIKMARFLSKRALQDVEDWSRGAPEVFCKVYYKRLGSLFDFAVGHVTVQEVRLGEDGWYSGSRSWLKFNPWKVVENWGNWRVLRWVPTALMTKMLYLFYEKDGEVKVTVNFSSREFTASVSDGDLVGSDWVLFADPLGKKYQVSNTFEFIIDQEKE